MNASQSAQGPSVLLCRSAIGARTTESQIHREMASGFSCPVGFKNGIQGNVQIALEAVLSTSQPHTSWQSPSTVTLRLQ